MSERGRLSRDGREQNRRAFQAGDQTHASRECGGCVCPILPPPYPFTTTIHAPLHYSLRLRVLTCKLKGLFPPRIHNRSPLPDSRRPPQPLPNIRLHLPQRPLRRPHRGKILLPSHPRHTRRPCQPDPHQHPQAEDDGRGGETVCATVYGE
jgi:hypothetical protein